MTANQMTEGSHTLKIRLVEEVNFSHSNNEKVKNTESGKLGDGD